MRYTQKLEDAVLSEIRANPTAHIVFRPDAYRPDGRIVVYRDNLTRSLNRRLWDLIFPDDQLTLGRYLRRTCREPRCQNPHHYAKTTKRGSGPKRCINGHEYTSKTPVVGGRRRCQICYEARMERRRVGGRRKGWCQNGHQLTDDNSYRWTDRRGRLHRRCKVCHLNNVRARRARRPHNTENGDTHHG